MKSPFGSSPSTDRTLTPVRGLALDACSEPLYSVGPNDPPWGAPAPSGHALAETPSSKFVFAATPTYVASGGYRYSRFTEFAVGTSGALRTVQTVTLGFDNVSSPSVDVQVSPSSKYLYVTDGWNLYSYGIGSTGALTKISQQSVPFSCSYGAVDMVMSPKGDQLYLSVPCQNIEQVSLDTTGHFARTTMTPMTGGGPLAISADGTTLYMGGDGYVTAYGHAGNGQLIQRGTPVYFANTIPQTLAVAPSGKALFLAVVDSSHTRYGLYTVPIANGLMTTNTKYLASAHNDAWGIAVHK